VAWGGVAWRGVMRGVAWWGGVSAPTLPVHVFSSIGIRCESAPHYSQ
jgi:hypothetical protein